MAISGDTGTSTGMVELGKKADLMILECSMPDAMKIEKHLTPTLCGQMARESACKSLCLTHFYPPCGRPDRDDLALQGRRGGGGEDQGEGKDEAHGYRCQVTGLRFQGCRFVASFSSSGVASNLTPGTWNLEPQALHPTP